MEKLCDFWMADQLVRGLQSQTTKEKLLAERAVDLEHFKEVALADESARSDAAKLTAMSKMTVGATFKPKGQRYNSNKGGHKKPFHNAASSNSQGQANPSNSTKCQACGGQGHSSNKDSRCPARGKECHNCGKTGHYERVCKGPKKMSTQPMQRVIRLRGLKAGRKIRRTRSLYVDVTIRSDKDAPREPLKMLVDTGSDVSGITRAQWNKYFQATNVTNASGLLNFDGSPINIEGHFMATIEFQGHTASVPLYVFDDSCSNTLGMDAMQAMDNLCIEIGSTRDAIHSLKCPDDTVVSVKAQSTASVQQQNPQRIKQFQSRQMI